jgi:hypothetical protein
MKKFTPGLVKYDDIDFDHPPEYLLEMLPDSPPPYSDVANLDIKLLAQLVERGPVSPKLVEHNAAIAALNDATNDTNIITILPPTKQTNLFGAGVKRRIHTRVPSRCTPLRRAWITRSDRLGLGLALPMHGRAR